MRPPAPSAPGAHLLAVRDIDGGYGEYRVLHGVDLHVNPGEVVALLGPNGHGKTTLLRMISGLLAPTRGQILYRGEEIQTRNPSDIVKLGISHIPQGDMVFPQMEVEANLLAGAYLRWRDRKERMDHVLSSFPQLVGRLGVQARVLSGGERRMLALARGMMNSPEILIVDEPSLGLAPMARDTVYELLESIVARGVAMLLVEEKSRYLRGLADRIYVLESGRIVANGPTDEILGDRGALLQAYLG